MRNRMDEATQRCDLVIKLATEMIERATKTHNNVEFMTYLKCSEILQNYASEVMKEDFSKVYENSY